MHLAVPSQDISEDKLERIALIWSAEALKEDEADRLDGLSVEDEFFKAALLNTEFLARSMTEGHLPI